MYHDLGLVKELNMNPITLKRWLVRQTLGQIYWKTQKWVTIFITSLYLLFKSWQFKKITVKTLSTTSAIAFVWVRWCTEWSICVTFRWAHGDKFMHVVKGVLVCVCQKSMLLAFVLRRGWLWQTCVFWWLQRCAMTWTTRDTTTRISADIYPFPQASLLPLIVLLLLSKTLLGHNKLLDILAILKNVDI